ncbi:MAG: polysaccharide deacetylase family protein [Ilumatobacteraceae bacterium]
MEGRRIVKQALGAVDRLRPTRSGVTVLIYHRVGGRSGSEVDLDVEVFRAQLEHLRREHEVISLDEAAVRLGSEPGDGDDRSAVVITVDDGTADFSEHLVPALIGADLPATLYVATSFVETGTPFPWGAPPLTWADIRDATSTGLVTIGSHTHTHRLLDRAEPTIVDDELDRSIELIGEHLGAAPRHFAYPKAVPGSSTAAAAVRRRFDTAAIAGSRVNRPGSTDLHALARTPVQRNDGLDFFAMKAAGGGRTEGDIRALLARVKYRRSTT